MSTQLDYQLGLKEESVFGTPVTVDRTFELNSESLKWMPKYAQGSGLRVGRRGLIGARRALVSQTVAGDFEVDLASKGHGVLFKAALGSSTNTIIGGSTAYQQVHTPVVDDPLPVFTVQKGAPLIGGARQPHTFPGMMCSGFSLNSALEAIVKLKTSWIGRELKTDIAIAAPAYPAGLELFTFLHGAIIAGGTLTMPTTTALASMTGTALANIKDFSIDVANNLDPGGMNYSGGGKLTRKKVVGQLDVKGKVTAEYTDNVLRDAYLAQTDLAMLFTLQSLVPISAGVFPTVQVVLPMTRLEGDIPQSNGGEPINLSIDFTALENLTNPLITVVYRTADTAV